MRRTAMLWEVFVSRFEEALEQYERHRLTAEEAGELLGMSGRNFRRLCVRYEEDGLWGLWATLLRCPQTHTGLSAAKRI
jgi:hypothetical protein